MRIPDAQEKLSSNASKDMYLVCGLIGPNIGLVGSGVCEIKSRFVLSCVRFCSPPPPGGSMLCLVSGDPSLSEKRSRFCIRTCPFDHPNIDPFGGRGGQHLARLKIKRGFMSQTPG